jgi:FkbM family methyltransferase
MTIFIDLLDFEAYQHTLRLFSGGGTESVLQSMFLKDGATFIDIGANHGAYSLFGAKQVGSSGRVFSIEPQPRLAAALRHSVSVNRLTNIEVEECAISNRLGEETFYLSSSSSGTASLFQSDMIDESRTLIVRVETLDAFASRHDIRDLQLLKVDAEGSEANVFRGAANVLTNLRPYVWFEFNPAALIEAGERVSVLAEVLSQYGYTRLYNLTSVVRGEPQEVKPSSNFLNIFAVHENREKEFAETLLNRRRVESPGP